MDKQTAKDIIQLCDSATGIIEQLLRDFGLLNNHVVYLQGVLTWTAKKFFLRPRPPQASPAPRPKPPMDIFETMKARAEKVLQEQSNED